MFELFIAFAAGLISFLSPCVLPLIPGYISYVSGSSLNELIEKKNINLIPIILFTVGFSIVFIIFGAASTFLGQLLLQNSFELRIIAGIIIIIFSLHIIGVINLTIGYFHGITPNYLYLCEAPIADNPLLFTTEWPYYFFVLVMFMFIHIVVIYYIFKAIGKVESSK